MFSCKTYGLLCRQSLVLALLGLMVSCVNDHPLDSTGVSPNILLIVSEDHGQDLGCYGNNVVYTPTLDSLAENGIRFINAYTTYSVCSPSRSSIFTGLYPHQNGQIGLATHGFRMYREFDNIPQYLKSKGYRTGSIGKIHVNPESAFPFDFQKIPESNFAKKGMDRYADEASKFMQSGDDPFFLMVNYPDAHFPQFRLVEGLPSVTVSGDEVETTLPFVGTDSHRLREVTADYYSQINRLDECVGMLLDSLRTSGKSDNTIIIYLSDHGAQFSRGKTTNYEAGLKIPMIVHWPNHLPEGKVIKEELVSVIDIFPTIIDVTKGKLKENLPGKSLFGLIGKHKNDEERRNYIFAEGHIGTAKYFYPRLSVRGQRYKLINNLYYGKTDPYFPVYTDHLYPSVVTGTNREEIKEMSDHMKEVYDIWENPPEYEFYDLEKDPWEFNNLATDPNYQEEMLQLKNVLQEWRVRSREPFLDPVIGGKLSAEVDSVNRKYPDHSYQKDANFSWNYPVYVGTYVYDEIK